MASEVKMYILNTGKMKRFTENRERQEMESIKKPISILVTDEDKNLTFSEIVLDKKNISVNRIYIKTFASQFAEYRHICYFDNKRTLY